MIKALLFDMDGVLVDSEGISIDVGIDYYSSIGVHATRDAFRDALGCGERLFFDRSASILGLYGPPYSYESASDFFRSRYIAAIASRNIALPGIDIVERARKAGIMTAVASSAAPWKVEANLASAGLKRSDFDYIVTGEDIKRNNPEKDIYELAMIKLGVDCGESVVFEDSKGGIESGRRAGCRVVSMMTTIDGATAEAAGASAVISDLSAIPPFSTADELEAILFDGDSSTDRVRYGASMIRPLSRRMPQEFMERRAIEAARKAWENAYAPYSGFHVGAAVVSAATGRIYSGCNVENSSYGATICAERNAMTSAITAEGSLGIDMLVVYSEDEPPAPPCAMCLQMMAEFARPETLVLLVSTKAKEIRLSFSQLLPMPFVFPTMR